MDNRIFISRLAKNLGLEVKETALLVNQLSATIAECLAENSNVAIPGFGNFESIKTLEHISVDAITGKRCLIPPSVTVGFTSGSHFKKTVKNS